MLFQLPLRPLYVYKRAFAQQEPGGKQWAVVRNLTKFTNGMVKQEVYEPHLPSKVRAMRIAKTLNEANPR